jgi:hypothetical protein
MLCYVMLFSLVLVGRRNEVRRLEVRIRAGHKNALMSHLGSILAFDRCPERRAPRPAPLRLPRGSLREGYYGSTQKGSSRVIPLITDLRSALTMRCWPDAFATCLPPPPPSADTGKSKPIVARAEFLSTPATGDVVELVDELFATERTATVEREQSRPIAEPERNITETEALAAEDDAISEATRAYNRCARGSSIHRKLRPPELHVHRVACIPQAVCRPRDGARARAPHLGRAALAYGSRAAVPAGSLPIALAVVAGDRTHPDEAGGAGSERDGGDRDGSAGGSARVAGVRRGCVHVLL